MKKRSIKIGDYDTAAYGWTLTGWTLTDPEQKTHYTEKSGGDGSWDLSTALTDGVPKYKDRELVATFECSEGSREDRQRLISHMVNLLDGYRWDIVLPDHPDHFLSGRVRVEVVRNSLGYAEVAVSAICGPWLYSIRETRLEIPTDGERPLYLNLRNNGRRIILPTISCADSFILVFDPDGKKIYLAKVAGVYTPLGYELQPGDNTLVVASNHAPLIITYREAVLR